MDDNYYYDCTLKLILDVAFCFQKRNGNVTMSPCKMDTKRSTSVITRMLSQQIKQRVCLLHAYNINIQHSDLIGL